MYRTYVCTCMHAYIRTCKHVDDNQARVLCCYSADTASVLIGGISDLINSRSIASEIFFTLCIPSVRLPNVIFVVVVVVFVYCFSAAVSIIRNYCAYMYCT